MRQTMAKITRRFINTTRQFKQSQEQKIQITGLYACKHTSTLHLACSEMGAVQQGGGSSRASQ